MPEEVQHKFVGDVRLPGRHEFRDHVLCMIAKDENPTDGKEVAVTTRDIDVTCPECLELIHA